MGRQRIEFKGRWWEQGPTMGPKQIHVVAPSPDFFDDGKTYTPAEVASILKLDRETIYRWTRAGKLRGMTLPSGDIRFQGRALNEDMRRRRG